MRPAWIPQRDREERRHLQQAEKTYWERQARFVHRQLPLLSLAVALTFGCILWLDMTGLEDLAQTSARASSYAPGRVLGIAGALACLLLGLLPKPMVYGWSHARLFLLCCAGSLSIAHASLVTYLGGGSPFTFPLINFVAFVAMPLPVGWAAAGSLLASGLFIAGLVQSGPLENGAFEAIGNTAILVIITLLIRDFLNRREFRVFQTQERLREAREQTERILLGVLPRQVVSELKEHGYSRPRLIPDVSVIFCDLVGFSQYAEHMDPERLVAKLDGLFSAFDTIARRHGLEKLKTIGDCYMAAGGLLKEGEDHPALCVEAALEMAEIAQAQIPATLPGGGMVPINVRVGIHCGPVVAGIIGTEKFLFDIWGDTVNIASRVETLSRPGKVTISRAVYERVKDSFECECLGDRIAKHDRTLQLWEVVGPAREDEDDDTPSPAHAGATAAALAQP